MAEPNGTKTTTATAGKPPSNQTRFIDEVFPKIAISSNIPYRKLISPANKPTELLLDVYQPDKDSAPNRPAIVWIHGGGFHMGDKSDPPMASLAERFAKRGYVTASINYRLAKKEDVFQRSPTFSKAALFNAVENASSDAREALRWLCNNAERFRIDKHRIAIGGGSAGAFTSLRAACVSNNETTGTGAGSPCEIRAVIDFWGGLLDAKRMSSNAPPIMIIHGTKDQVVPFFFAERLVTRAKELGVTCEFYPLEGEGHSAWIPLDRHMKRLVPFLNRHVARPDQSSTR